MPEFKVPEFKVIDIIDGDTIKVSPGWKWTNQEGIEKTGDTVKIIGYKLPTKGSSAYQFAFQKLKSLLLNKFVVLKNPRELLTETNNFACRVFLNGVDVSDYFPDYKI